MGSLLIPGGLPGLSRTLVVRAGDGLDGLVLPVMDATDILPVVIDLSAWLAQLGLTITGAIAVQVTQGLGVAGVTYTAAGIITLQQVSWIGPVPIDAAMMQLDVLLSGGDRIRVVVAQPVEQRAPAGLVPVIAIGALADAAGPWSDATGYLLAA